MSEMQRKRGTKKWKSDKETIKESGEHIVIQHARWGRVGNNWEQNNKMDNSKFKLTNKDGVELTYDRVGEICYWERHYIYKDYLEKCTYGKEKRKI